MECMLVHISQWDCEVIMNILQRGAFFSNREVVLLQLLLASPFGEYREAAFGDLDCTEEYTGIRRNMSEYN